MKRTIYILLILTNAHFALGQTQEPTWGAGFRFNGPKGITIKKYFHNDALEFIAGRPSRWKYHRHYDWGRNNNLLSSGYTYGGNEYAYAPWTIQLHYLRHKQISPISQLHFYYGAGAQFRSMKFYDHYYYDDGISIIHLKEEHTEWGIGADMTVGLEYRFTSIPFTIFYDLTSYVEIVEHPMFIKIQGGFGARYNF